MPDETDVIATDCVLLGQPGRPAASNSRLERLAGSLEREPGAETANRATARRPRLGS